MATPSPTFSLGGYGEIPIETVGAAPRAIARIIDHVVHLAIAVCSGFFLGIVIMIVSAVTGHDPHATFQRLSGGGKTFTSLALSLLGLIAYHTICEGLHGSSVGKMIMGITVTMDDGQQPCTFVAAAKRSLGYIVDSLFFGLIGYFAMKEPPHQRNGDAWADTLVRKRRLLDPTNRRSGLRFIAVLLLAAIVDSMLVTSAVMAHLF